MTTVFGTSANDTINANSNNEYIDGQGGSDDLSSTDATTGIAYTGVTLDNRSGNHDMFAIVADTGASVIGGNGGNDTVSIMGGGAGAADTIDTQQGQHDYITDNNGSGNVLVLAQGAVGNISPGNNVIALGNGNDTVATGGQNGSGHNNVTLGNGNNVLSGFFSTGDALSFGNGNNIIYPGLGGGHTVTVGNGNNIIMAVSNTSGDTVNAGNGTGQDVINTGAGNNLINTNGHSIVYFTDTHAGNDTLNDGTGGDLLSFFYAPQVSLSLADTSGSATIGSHNFSITAPANVARFYLSESGSDTLTLNGTHSYNVSSAGNIYTGVGNDVINAATNSGNDTLYGNIGNDTITSGSGNNIIDGTAGNNVITGNGHDLIYVDTGGNDTLTSGTGANDTLSFVYDPAAATITLSGTTGTASDGSHSVSINTAAGNSGALNLGNNDTVTGGLGSTYTINASVGDSITGGAQESATYNVNAAAGGDVVNLSVPTNGTGQVFAGVNDYLNGGITTNFTTSLPNQTAILNYFYAGTAVNVNLTTGAVTGGNSLGDTVVGNSFDAVEGSAGGHDTMVGSANPTTFYANGHESITAGASNFNTINFQNSSVGVSYNAGTNANSDNDTISGGFIIIDGSNAGHNNLTLSANGGNVVDFGGNSTITGGSGNTHSGGITGFTYGTNNLFAAPNDLLIGGTGAQTVNVFSFVNIASQNQIGNEVIQGFRHGPDQIDISHTWAANFAALQPDITTSGGNSVITFSAGNTITVQGDTNLQSSDFAFV